MSYEAAAKLILEEKDDMTGVETALLTVLQHALLRILVLEARIEKLEAAPITKEAAV